MGIIVSATTPAETFRIATWNISNYSGGRTYDLQNAVYGSYQDRKFAPDILFAQEILSEPAAISLRNALNAAPGSPGDWKYYDNGFGTRDENTFFYRATRVTRISSTRIAYGTTSTIPRDLYRFDLRIKGNSAHDTISVYNVHMKTGGGSANELRRQAEAQLIRDDANKLASGFIPIVLGDFNIRHRTEQAYQTLTQSGSNERGRFLDPIGTPGTWYERTNMRFVHTQDPSGPGGMDDRLDQILVGAELNDGLGTEYKGAFGRPYSTATWNDLNHSYRVWGNDGTSFNSSLTVNGNEMVGDSIAQSLVNIATASGGHLPVFLDLEYTPAPESPGKIVLGAGLALLVITIGGGVFAFVRTRNGIRQQMSES